MDAFTSAHRQSAAHAGSQVTAACGATSPRVADPVELRSGEPGNTSQRREAGRVWTKGNVTVCPSNSGSDKWLWGNHCVVCEDTSGKLQRYRRLVRQMAAKVPRAKPAVLRSGKWTFGRKQPVRGRC